MSKLLEEISSYIKKNSISGKEETILPVIESTPIVEETVTEEPKEITEDDKSVIESFLIKKDGLTDLGLVSLICLHNGKTINETSRKELEVFEFIKENKLTPKGTFFLNEEATIDRLKKMII
jgi:hypothetical protein